MARTLKEIPINGYLLENTFDKTNKGSYVNDAYDVIIDILKINKNRPGLQCKYYDSSSSTTINGVYYWEAQDVLVGVIGGVPCKFTRDSNESYNMTSISNGTDSLNPSNKVYFAGNSKYLIMTNGTKMIQWDGSADAEYVADADAPVTVDVVEYIDNYILALDKTNNKWYFSDATAGVNSPITWSGDYYSFESKPDSITSIVVSNSVIYGICSTSIESWYNDGSPFSRVSGGVVNVGCSITDSVKELDGIIYFVGSDNKIYSINQTTISNLSILIDNELDSLDFTGAYSEILDINGLKFYIVNIPVEDLSYVYSINDNGWLKWSNYDDGSRTEFKAKNIIKYGTYIVATDNDNTAIYEITSDADVDDKLSETDYGTYIYESDLEAGIEPYTGILLSMVSGDSHLYGGKSFFRSKQNESTFSVVYETFGSDNLTASRSSDATVDNLNRKYTLECVSGGTGTTIGEFTISSDGYADVTYQVQPGVGDWPYFYYPDEVTSDLVFKMTNPYTGDDASTGTITKVAGTFTTSTSGFLEDNFESISTGAGLSTTFTITVSEESQINIFELKKQDIYPIVWEKKTSYVDHGTWNYKISRLLQIKLNRDFLEYKSPDGVLFEMRYRDNGSIPWSIWTSMQMKNDSDGFYVYVRNLGRYSSRQYHFRCVSPVQVTVDKVFELIDITNRSM